MTINEQWTLHSADYTTIEPISIVPLLFQTIVKFHIIFFFQRDRLKEEQLHHIKTLLKQAKERDKELEEISVVNKEQVEVSLKDKWKCSKEQDQELEGMTIVKTLLCVSNVTIISLGT